MQLFFQMEQTTGFRFRQLLYGDAGPLRNDVGHVFFRHDELRIVMALLFLLQRGDFIGNLLAFVTQRRAPFKLFTSQSRVLFLSNRRQPLFQGLHVLRRRVDLHAHAGRRFIDDVDGLVRQIAVRNVPGRQFDGSPDCFVGNARLVKGFVPIPQAEYDLFGLAFRRLADEDGLKAAGQGRVLFQIFLVFVDRRRANALQLAPRQGRLEDIGRIHRALYGSRADELVKLVDE